jgi:hypothetical protein
MKSVITLVLLVCALVALALWWSPELRDQARALLRETGVQPTSVTLYKWQNENGTWQYTQQAPPPGVPYEEIEARSDVNVLPLPEQLRNE